MCHTTHLSSRKNHSVCTTISKHLNLIAFRFRFQKIAIEFCIVAHNQVIFNEINTLPGFTSISMYPKLFAASGIPYPELIDQLIALACEAQAS